MTSFFKKTYWIFSLFIIISYSCQDVIKVNLPQGKTTLSVDAVLTNRGYGDTILLSTTTGYFSDSAFAPFKGARVTISDSLGAPETLTESSPGKFPIHNTHAQLNHTYYLDIYTSTDHFRGITQVKRISPTLDSVKYEYEAKSVRYDTAGYYLYFWGQELPGQGDNIWMRVYRNNKYLSNPRDIFAFVDTYTDGKYYQGVSLRTQEAFQVGDVARVEAWSINKEAYNYLDQIQTQINNRGIFQTTPANVPTNILNTNPSSSNTATGFFIGSLVSSNTSTISK